MELQAEQSLQLEQGAEPPREKVLGLQTPQVPLKRPFPAAHDIHSDVVELQLVHKGQG